MLLMNEYRRIEFAYYLFYSELQLPVRTYKKLCIPETISIITFECQSHRKPTGWNKNMYLEDTLPSSRVNYNEV